MEQSTTALRRHIDAIWPGTSDLLEASEHVSTLDGHYGWEAVQKVLVAEIAMIDRELDGASTPLSQAEYALKHGRRGGLKAALGAARAITSKADEKIQKLEAAGESVAGRS